MLKLRPSSSDGSTSRGLWRCSNRTRRHIVRCISSLARLQRAATQQQQQQQIITAAAIVGPVSVLLLLELPPQQIVSLSLNDFMRLFGAMPNILQVLLQCQHELRMHPTGAAPAAASVTEFDMLPYALYKHLSALQEAAAALIDSFLYHCLSVSSATVSHFATGARIIQQHLERQVVLLQQQQQPEQHLTGETVISRAARRALVRSSGVCKPPHLLRLCDVVALASAYRRLADAAGAAATAATSGRHAPQRQMPLSI